MQTRSISVHVMALILLSGMGLQAGEIAETEIAEGALRNLETEPVREESVFDQLWALPVLYENDHNPIVQRFRLKGRYLGQYAIVESNRGSFDDWSDRQARIGADLDLWCFVRCA